MHRRALVRRALAAAGAGLAGCAGVPAGRPPTAEVPAHDASLSVPLAVDLACDPEAAGAHDLGVRLVHVAQPTCWYDDPQCDAAAGETTVLDRSARLPPGDSHSFDASLPLTPSVDVFSVEARVDDGENRTVAGIEAGARPVVGDALDEYDWRAGWTATLSATALAGGGLSLGVGG